MIKQDDMRNLAISEKLFDCLPDVVYFVKNAAGAYLSVNDTLVTRCGLREKSELIGRKPSEMMGKHLGEGYEKQDRLVISTGQTISNQLELHIYPNRKIGWCLTHKHPLVGEDGKAIGVAGVSQDLRAPDISHKDYARLAEVIAFVQDNLSTAPQIEMLSRLARLSPYQLNLRVERIFGLTTGQWILKQRLDHARQLLVETDTAIADVALDVGYADQSAFTRQFRNATGLTPSQFRNAHSE